MSLAAAAIAFAGLPSILSKVVMGFSQPEEVEPILRAVQESEDVSQALLHDAPGAGLLAAELILPRG